MTFGVPLFVRAGASDDPISFDAIDFRQLIDAAFSSPGVGSSTALKVTQRGAGANESVDIAAGLGLGIGLTPANDGKYLTLNDSVVNVPIPPTGGTEPPATGTKRTDSVVLQFMDRPADTNTNVGILGYTPQALIVPGAAVSTSSTANPPVLPDAMSGTVAAYLELARLARVAGESSIVTSAITDVRTLARGAGLGSLIYVPANGLGTYDPAKPVHVVARFAEPVTNSSGFATVALPSGVTAVCSVQATPAFRVSPTPTDLVIAFRVDQSTTSTLSFLCRHATDGSVAASVAVALSYRIEYQTT